MRWFRQIRARFRYRNLDAQLREEIEFHRALTEETLEAHGLTKSEARRQAARRLGNARVQREVARDDRRGTSLLTLERWASDIRRACQRLVRTPSFSLFAIVTLAVGIGATMAVHAVVAAVLGPTPGVADIERIVQIRHTRAGSGPMTSLSWPDFVDLADRQTVFDRLTGFTASGGTVAANGQAAAVLIEAVGGQYFEALGVGVQIGRLLGPADDDVTAEPAVVISDRFWEHFYQRSPSAVGSRLRANEGVYTVVGVANPAFAGSFNGGLTPTAVWISLAGLRVTQTDATIADFSPLERERRWVHAIGRLAPGVTLEQAQAGVSHIAAQLDAEVPIGRDLNPRTRMPFNTSRPWVAVPLGESRFGDVTTRIVRPVALTLLAATILVLLIAATNLANLSMARWVARRHELALRMALGGSRGRVTSEMVWEVALLALAGGTAGFFVARSLLSLFGRELVMGRGFSLAVDSQVSATTFAVAGLAVLLALLVAGAIPAWRVSRLPAREVLATEGLTTTSRWRGRRYLVAVQVAASAFLVLLAALAYRQVQATLVDPLGIDVDRLAIAQVDFRVQGYEPARAIQLTGAVLSGLDQYPGTVRTAAASGLPDGDLKGLMARVASGGQDLAESRQTSEYVAATPAIFETLGLTVTRGRVFDVRDGAADEPVAVVSETLAEALFEGEPIGRTIAIQRQRYAGQAMLPVEFRRVIGVVRSFGDAADVLRRDAHRGFFSDPRGRPGEQALAIYVPLSEAHHGRVLFIARTVGNPQAAVPLVERTIRAIDPEIAIAQSGTGRRLSSGNRFYEIAAPISAFLGLLALVLALTGLHGVLSQVVRSRTREIGLRRALGAPLGGIYRTVVLEGLGPVLAGLAIGVGGGLLMSAAIGPVVQLLAPRVDPAAIAIVAMLFIAAGIVAAWGPARRAARVDPLDALKSE